MVAEKEVRRKFQTSVKWSAETADQKQMKRGVYVYNPLLDGDNGLWSQPVCMICGSLLKEEEKDICDDCVEEHKGVEGWDSTWED